MDEILKTCTKCKEGKPFTAFSKSKKTRDGHAYYCKVCKAQYAKDWFERNGGVRSHNLKQAYGITQADYESMLEEQGGCCAICGTKNTGHTAHFAVDHDHATGKVRGLLCSLCNTGLGGFRDDPKRLEAAINYILTNTYVCCH
jgi:hypothetical protein